MMEADFRALLTGDPIVAGIVGSRIDWVARREGDPLPGIRLQVISQPQEYALKGAVGLQDYRIQVDCFADTFTEVQALATAVIVRLSGHVGGGFTGVFHVSRRDGREGGTDDADRPFRISLDFRVRYQPNGV